MNFQEINVEYKQTLSEQAAVEFMNVKVSKGKNGIVFPYLSFPKLEKYKQLVHGFTTRLGGVSQGEFDSLNLSFSRGDDKELVLKNYERLKNGLHLPENGFVFSNQTHTTNVVKVTSADLKKEGEEISFSDVDGLITKEKNVPLITFYADCVPLYFYDPVKKAIGLSHSGWRGTVKAMARKTIQAMEKEFACEAQNILCGIGPCICQACYEVGQEVADEFLHAFPQNQNQIIQPKDRNKFVLNLVEANKQVLLEYGISPKHIMESGICTCCNHQLLFSHRASKGKRGNLAAVLMLN